MQIVNGVKKTKLSILTDGRSDLNPKTACRRRKSEKKPCLLCRSTDHVLKDCPKNKDKHNIEVEEILLQLWGYLTPCSKMLGRQRLEMDLRLLLALYVILVGHLSSQCDQTKNGIYPNGGCCRVCGENTHLAKNCPSKNKKLQANNEANLKETEITRSKY